MRPSMASSSLPFAPISRLPSPTPTSTPQSIQVNPLITSTDAQKKSFPVPEPYYDLHERLKKHPDFTRDFTADHLRKGD